MKFSAGSEGTKEGSSLCNAIWNVCDELKRHEPLSVPLEAEMKDVQHRLSVFLCPYHIEELRQASEGI